MNSAVYVFGELGNGYTQYPNDHSKSVFQETSSSSSASSQIYVRRDGDLMYYAYTRQLNQSSGTYIGIAFVLNSVIVNDLARLFKLFEDSITDMVVNGEILEFTDDGDITSNVSKLYKYESEFNRVSNLFSSQLGMMDCYEKMPPINYSIDKDKVKKLIYNDDNESLSNATKYYARVVITKGDDVDSLTLKSFSGKLRNLNNKKKALEESIAKQKEIIEKLNHEKKQTKVVSLLSVLLVVMFGIIYFTVINPSEVTHYETGEFTYYGPLKDKKPNGIGVAIYPENDPEGRRYYIGNFENGKRSDSIAMLLYRDGDYFYGSMVDDNWIDGLFYSKSDKSHFEGRFNDNIPYHGFWYDHKRSYEVVLGKNNY